MTRVEPSATVGGFDFRDAMAKKPTTPTRTMRIAPVMMPSKNLPKVGGLPFSQKVTRAGGSQFRYAETV